MSQPPPQPPELPSGPPSFSPSPPALPSAPPPIPQGPAAYLPPPARRSLASRPIFWIVLFFGIIAFFSILAAGAFSAYSKIIKGVKEKKAKQEALAEVAQLRQEQRTSMRKELDETGFVSGPSDDRLGKMQQILEKSGKSADDDAAAARAAAAWVQKFKDTGKRYSEATNNLSDPPIMEASSLKSKADIALRRVQVQEFMAANQELSALFTNMERDLTVNLRAEGIPQSKISALIQSTTASARKKEPILKKIRTQDAAMGEILVKWLDLIETEWGFWSVENDALTFSNPTANENNKQWMEDLDKIATAQAEAQRQMVELQQ